MINLGQYRQFLTKNERNRIYLRKNSVKGRETADSKYKTKKKLRKGGIAVPNLIARFKTPEEVERFEWEKLEGNFVVKPVSGYGGEGIMIIRRRIIKKNDQFFQQSRTSPCSAIFNFQTMTGEVVTIEDLKINCQEILAGRYSLHGVPDSVLIEERIRIHPLFLALTHAGTPDIRVIVYNKVPVMAMLRVPTEKSSGKANLQQGAIGLGIDLATGITTYGIEGKGTEIVKIYDYGKKKKRKVNGIKIPFWKEILLTAMRCQKTVDGLGFLGVDVVLDKERGPMVLEVNARPGLSIQICNKAGLKARMEKVEEINVRSEEHGLMLAKYLFGESFFEKVEEKEKIKTVGPLEVIKVKLGKGKKNVKEVRAKIDTGAFRSSMDRKFAEELGLLREDKVLYYRHYRSSLGKHNDRPVIGLTFWLKGKKMSSAVNVADRSKLRTKFLLGRKDLAGFLVSTKP